MLSIFCRRLCICDGFCLALFDFILAIVDDVEELTIKLAEACLNSLPMNNEIK